MGSTYRFGRFELDPARRQLLADGIQLTIGARAFDVLVALAERSDRLVAKDELLALGWPGLVVEENNLQVQISALRKLLGPQVIATIPGRGYRFVASTDGAAAAGAERVAAPGATSPSQNTPTNLPVEPPELIGRASELAELRESLRQYRLVTVTGAGGIGKTQLARAVAHSLRGAYADGVWVVELAWVADAAHVFSATAQLLGVDLPARRPPQRVLAEALAGKRLLLVLDNCEHVIDNVALLVDALLAGAPGVHLLATSREPLKLPREHQYHLGALALPEQADVASAMQYGAVALFVARAQAVEPHFALDGHNVAAVIDICRHLDGIPLAIELAAARLPLLGVDGLHERLGERFRILTAGSRFALRRHQTLHAALDWSHGLLSADEQAVFRRLGVFAGGCTLEAAQQLAADEHIGEWAVLEHLGALVDKSMVVARGGNVPRYELLETMRAYALEQLARSGETERLLRRHAEVIAALFERAFEERCGEQGFLSEAEYLDRVAPEIDNLRAALTWATGAGGDPRLATSMVASANLAEAFFRMGLLREGIEWLKRVMPTVAADGDRALATRYWCAVAGLGILATTRQPPFDDKQLRYAFAEAERGCRALAWPHHLYHLLLSKAWWLSAWHEFEGAEAALAEAIRIEQPQWPAWSRSGRWLVQGNLAVQAGALDKVSQCNEAIDRMLPLRGEECRRDTLLINRAMLDNRYGRWAQAAARLAPFIDEVLPRRRHPQRAGSAHAHIVLALTELGRLDESRQRLLDALPLWRAAGEIDRWLFVVIRLLLAQGHVQEAMRLVGREDAASPFFHLRAGSLTNNIIHAQSRRQIEMAEPSAEQREQRRREGEALDEDGVVALYYLAAGDAPAASTVP